MRRTSAAVNRLDERRELRRDPRVQLHDLNRALGRHEELDVEEARVQPVRGHEHRRELCQLGSRRAASADGYSKRSNEFVPGYFTESVTPITVTSPSCT